MIGTLYRISKIKKGKETMLSKREIVSIMVNLMDAKKNLPENQFLEVKALYYEIREDKTKRRIGLGQFVEIVEEIERRFNTIAPLYSYNGQR